MFIEPSIEPCFDQDSYGYRPNRSASDAIAKARERCFKFGWVLDMDISKFFDTIDHDLLMKAVECHVREKWVLLYIRRWLKVPYRTSKGETIERTMGVPQGSVIGPVLANLFLHYTFDKWMRIHYPHIPFERYADDTICHCVSKAQAEHLKEVLTRRFEQCRLKLNVEKTKIVQCPTSTRKKVVGSEASFDFLGYIWRPRGPPSQWLGLSGQMVKRCDEVAQRLQLVLRHNYRLDSLAVEHQHAVDQIHRSDIADVDDIAAAHAEKRRRLVGRSITRSDGFIENGQGGEMRTHLAITEIEIGVVAVGLQIDDLVEIDHLYAVARCDEKFHNGRLWCHNKVHGMQVRC